MTQAVLVQKLNKEVQTLRRDVRRIQSVLARVIALPQESVQEYGNEANVRKAYQRALKTGFGR